MKAEATLRYSDGIAGTRTLIALEAKATALQQRLPDGWDLAPYAGDDLRGKAFTGAHVRLAFHEVFAIRNEASPVSALPQVSCVAFVSQARNRATEGPGHVHWLV
jgi:hypothetical protein